MENIKNISKELKNQSPPLEITFHSSGDDSDFSNALLEIAEGLANEAGKGIKLSQGDGNNLPVTPAITFNHSDCGMIHYMALPEGQEVAPFQEMITRNIQGVANLPDDLKASLHALEKSVEILVFIASTCPHCPQAVRAAHLMSLNSKQVTTAVIDVQRFSEFTDTFKIRSVPMVVIDKALMINEAIAPVKLAELVLSRESVDFQEKALLSLVAFGNIDKSLNLLFDLKNGAEVFLFAWKKSIMSQRMGLMLMAEQALKEDAAVFNGIVSGLCDVLKMKDVTLRGDTADLLGQIGHRDAIEPLKALLNDANEDVVEIAREALEKIESETR
ncbi:MAG: thioredoxin family protein [Desulfobacterales bacterium]|nr:thioredoxin family protein [Desulfobacterales bacterium]